MEVDEAETWGRKEIWHNAIRFNVSVPLYIDCRLGGEMVQVYTVRPSSLEDVANDFRGSSKGLCPEPPKGFLQPADIAASRSTASASRFIMRPSLVHEEHQ